MSGAERLYTPELLALTLKLAAFPYDEGLPFFGDARSKSCGSTLALRLGLDEAGKIERVGMRVQACAVGQASAALFAEAAPGQERSAIGQTTREMERWLSGEGDLPNWPGIEILQAARDYPARHGAIMLPWRAALAALSTTLPSG